MLINFYLSHRNSFEIKVQNQSSVVLREIVNGPGSEHVLHEIWYGNQKSGRSIFFQLFHVFVSVSQAADIVETILLFIYGVEMCQCLEQR